MVIQESSRKLGMSEQEQRKASLRTKIFGTRFAATRGKSLIADSH